MPGRQSVEPLLYLMDGQVNALAALIYAVSTRNTHGNEFGIPEYVLLGLLGNAKALISRQHDGAMRVAASLRCAISGWAIVSALVTVCPSWCIRNAAQIFGMWSITLRSRPRGSLCAGSKTKIPLLACVNAALVGLCHFVKLNQNTIRESPGLAKCAAALFSIVVLALDGDLSSTENHDAPGFNQLTRLHSTLFDTASYISMDMLMPEVNAYVLNLAISYFARGSRSKDKTTLLSRGGLLSCVDDALEDATGIEGTLGGGLRRCGAGISNTQQVEFSSFRPLCSWRWE